LNIKKKKILCIDIEGGNGGSSRSLFYLISTIVEKKNHQFDISVICRKDSWVKNKYKKIGVKCSIDKSIPRFTPLINPSRNIYQTIIFILKIWPQSSHFRRKMIKFKEFDIIHFNHISLGILALWCKFKNLGINKVMHIRTLPPKNIFSKLLCYFAKKSCSNFIYITENEKNHLHSLIKGPQNEAIIYNPVKTTSKLKKIYIKNEKSLKVGILSNFSYNRGIDRALEIFEAIPLNKRNFFIFMIAGDMTLEKNIPLIPKSFTNHKKNFSDFVKTKKYKDSFLFLGQLKKPENFLKSIDVLLKPTRLNNPWGRDILEALSFGKPVISIGTYKKFVETKKTGFLQKKYNAKKIADWLVNIEANRHYLNTYSYEAKKRIKEFCDPNKSSEKLIKIWKQ